MCNNIIEVKGLSKRFEYYVKGEGVKESFKNFLYRKKLYKDSVKNVSFNIKEGEFVGFLGPNGAGKTTTLKMLSGILFPTGGEATVAGYVPWQRKLEYKKQFSIIMGQKNQLWLDLPACDSLRLNQCIYEIEEKEYQNTLAELSEMLDVKKVMNIQVRRLSLGERMKLEIIASLLHKPKIVFLDEPTIGLDISSQKKIRSFLSDYNRQYNTTIILTSHYMKDIEDLCERIIVINEGELVYDGDKKKLSEISGKNKVVSMQLAKEVNREELSHYGKIRKYEEGEVELEIDKNQSKEILPKLVSNFQVLDFSVEDVSLEESLELLYKK